MRYAALVLSLLALASAWAWFARQDQDWIEYHYWSCTGQSRGVLRGTLSPAVVDELRRRARNPVSLEQLPARLGIDREWIERNRPALNRLLAQEGLPPETPLTPKVVGAAVSEAYRGKDMGGFVGLGLKVHLPGGPVLLYSGATRSLPWEVRWEGREWQTYDPEITRLVARGVTEDPDAAWLLIEELKEWQRLCGPNGWALR